MNRLHPRQAFFRKNRTMSDWSVRRSHLAAILAAAFLATAAVCSAETTDTSEDSGWIHLPSQRRIVEPLLASPLETQTRLKFGCQKDGPTLFQVTFGDDMVLFRREFAADHAIDVSFRGLIAARFAANQESFPLQSSDYLGGFACGYQRGPNEFEALLFHVSSHLGDEPLDFGERERINYSRNSLRLLWSRRFEDLRLYVAPIVDFSPGPENSSRRMRLQCGAEYYFDFLDKPWFIAADTESIEANDWSANLTGQVGMFLTRQADHPFAPRIFLEVFTGHSAFGQYWNESETNFMVGVGSSW